MLINVGSVQIINVSLSDDQWTQASLPVRSGCICLVGVWLYAQRFKAFLASAASTQSLQNLILHKCQMEEEDTSASLLNWRSLSVRFRVTGPSPEYQPESVEHCSRKANFSVTTGCKHRARLLAAAAAHGGRLALSSTNHRMWTPPER